MRNRVGLGLIVAALAVGLPVTASGSVFTNGLSYNDAIDVLQDNSVSRALFDQAPGQPGYGILSQGDIIAGIVTWTLNIADGKAFGATTHTLFSAQYAGNLVPAPGARKVGADPALYGSLVPTPIGTGLSIKELLGAQAIGNGPTFGAVLSATNGPDVTILPGGFWAAVGALNAPPWTLDGTFGIVPGINANGGVDFFEGDIRDHDGPGTPVMPWDSPGVISILDTDGDGYVDEWDDFVGPGPGPFFTGSLTGLEAGAFSVLVNNFAPYGLWAVSSNDLAGNVTTSDIVMLPSTQIVQATAGQVAIGYSFADNAWAALNPKVPEPASLLIWASLLGLAVGYGGWRRRK